MNPENTFIHALGTHPLVVSIIGQCFVLYETVRAKDKSAARQSEALIAALVLVVVTIQIRPPSPPDPWADGLGVVAAAMFILPVAGAFRKARRQRPDKGD